MKFGYKSVLPILNTITFMHFVIFGNTLKESESKIERERVSMITVHSTENIETFLIISHTYKT